MSHDMKRRERATSPPFKRSIIGFRTTPRERGTVEAAALRNEETLSAFVRRTVLEAAGGNLSRLEAVTARLESLLKSDRLPKPQREV